MVGEKRLLWNGMLIILYMALGKDLKGYLPLDMNNSETFGGQYATVVRKYKIVG